MKERIRKRYSERNRKSRAQRNAKRSKQVAKVDATGGAGAAAWPCSRPDCQNPCTVEDRSKPADKRLCVVCWGWDTLHKLDAEERS